MDEPLLILPNTSKGNASPKDEFPFMSISLNEWKAKSDEAMAKALNDSCIGYIPSVEDFHQTVMDYVEAQPHHKPVTFWSEVPRNEGVHLHHQIQQEVWFVPLMFILFWGFGLVLSARFAYITQALREFFYPKSRSNVFSDRITDEFGFKSAMTVLSFSTITIFCQLVLHNLFHVSGYEGLHGCLSILLALVGYFIFKTLSTLYICTIFFDKSTFSTVRHSYTTLVFALCMTLFPFVVLASFTAPIIANYSLIAGCIICAIAVLLYLYKILSIFFSGLTSIFYLILYLCTLEILPIAALAGMLLS